ncbi:1281_t:CDS:2, partial [Scutellospora calospora]
FKISISKWYPAKEGWKVIVKDPLMFARYLRIDFLSHYGRQYYCPVSSLRVYGSDEYEKWKREQEEIENQILKSTQKTQEIISPSKTSHDTDVGESNLNDDNSSLLMSASPIPNAKKDLVKELPEQLKNPSGLKENSSNLRSKDKINTDKNLVPLIVEICPVKDIYELFQYKS